MTIGQAMTEIPYNKKIPRAKEVGYAKHTYWKVAITYRKKNRHLTTVPKILLFSRKADTSQKY